MASRRDRALLFELVDLVLQCGVEGQRRFVTQVGWRGGFEEPVPLRLDVTHLGDCYWFGQE